MLFRFSNNLNLRTIANTFSSKTARKRKKLASSGLTFQKLEDRKLLASVVESSGVVTLQGDATDDIITMYGNESQTAFTVSINGDAALTQTFQNADISKVIVYAGAGNDEVKNTLQVPTEIYGQAGDDVLNGGSSTDEIHGGTGDDILDGGIDNSVDRLFGGTGYDQFTVVAAGDSVSSSVGDVNYGIAVGDAESGPGFILHSPVDVFSRFSESPPQSGNSTNLIAVRFADNQWQYNDNSAWHDFAPINGDRLIASVDFGADTITSLAGTNGQVGGISQGFESGDLTFAANQWAGVSNAGEFTVDGTQFTVLAAGGSATSSVGDINYGIAVGDAESGTGFILHSPVDVFSRFSESPPQSGNSTNLIAVRFADNQWQYNDNSTWHDFAPINSDRLIASVDFGADTITSLAGTTGQVGGISQGFESGDLTFAANQWAGVSNAGEFTVDGTQFNVAGDFGGGGDQVLDRFGTETYAGYDGQLTHSIELDGDAIKVNGTDAEDVYSIIGFNSGSRFHVRRSGLILGTYDTSEISEVVIRAGGGDDRLTTNESQVTVPIRIYGEAGDDWLEGGSGNDSIFGGNGDDSIFGRDGDDTLSGNAGADKIYGHAGNDEINGGEGNDQAWGGSGDDFLGGNEGDDQLRGENGDDTLRGDEGNDYLHGGLNNDALFGSAGLDELWGGAHDDVLNAGADAAADKLWGNGGFDQFFADPNTDDIRDRTSSEPLVEGTSSIGALIFNDANGDGVRQSGEAGISGVSVKLLRDGTEVASTTSNSSGDYLFDNLMAGSYAVQLVADGLVDYEFTTATSQNVALADDEDNNSADFGLKELPPGTGSIGDLVFEDANENGQADAGELGVAGAVVNLIQGGQQVATTTTDSNGLYQFNALRAGEFQVQVDESSLSGRMTTTATTFSVSLENGESEQGIDFGATEVDLSPASNQLASAFSQTILEAQIEAFASTHATQVEAIGDLLIVDTGVRKVFFKPVPLGFGLPVYRYGGDFSHLMPNELAADLNTLSLLNPNSSTHVVNTGEFSPIGGTLVSEVVSIDDQGLAQKIGLVIEDRGDETYTLTPASGSLVNTDPEVGFEALGRPSKSADLIPYQILLGGSDFSAGNFYVSTNPVPIGDPVKIVQKQGFAVQAFAAATALDAKTAAGDVGAAGEKSFLNWANNETIYASQGRDLTITPGEFTFGKNTTVNIASNGGEFDGELKPTRANGAAAFPTFQGNVTSYFVETKSGATPFQDTAQTAYQLAYIANLNKQAANDIAYVRVVNKNTTKNTIQGFYDQKNVAASNVKIVVITFDFEAGAPVDIFVKRPE